jgi:paraquat-inducible protein B
LNAILKDAQQVVKHIDGEIEPLLGHSQQTLTAARQTLEQIRQTLAALKTSSTPAMEQAERAFAALTDFVNAESAVLSQAVEEIDSAARAIRVLAEYLQRNPEALLRGKGR